MTARQATTRAERPRDALGRPLMPCCGALDLRDSDHGGRPFQCPCEYRAFMAGQMRLGL